MPTVPPNVLPDSRFSYFLLQTHVATREEAGPAVVSLTVEDLGKRFAMDALTLKLYPACKYAHGAIEGMLNLRRRHPFRTDEVKRIRVRVPEMSYSSVCVPDAASG